MTSRRTSATVTLSMTWSRPRTVMPLTTLAAVADQPRRRDRRPAATPAALATAARQHHAVADAFDADVGVGHGLLERGAHAVEVARDRDVETGDLPAVGVEEEDVGLPDGDADHVGAARGADHGVGDLGIGDQHVLDVARQVDHDRFADAERNEARGGLACRHLDHRRARVGRDHRHAPAQGPAPATIAASAAARINVLLGMSPVPLDASFRRRHRAHAKANHVDPGPAGCLAASSGCRIVASKRR